MSAGISRTAPQVKTKSWASLLLPFVLLTAFLLPRLAALGRFVTPDEPTWAKRSGSFYYALSQADFAGTYLTGHPGVTTMWAGAIAYAWQFPEYSRVGQREIGDTKLFTIFQRHGPRPMELLAAARLVAVLFNAAALLVAYFYARRLFGELLAFFGFLLIAFDPFYTAHTRVLHTNAFLASFAFLAVLAFLDFLRFRRPLSLVVSGAAAGLSFITVTPGFFLIPIIGILALAAMFWEGEAGLNRSLRRWARRFAAPLLAWGGVSLLIVFLVWPSMWVNPLGTLRQTLTYSLSAAEGEIGGAHFVEAYQAQGATGSMYLYYYPLTFLWRSTSVVLAGLALGLVAWAVTARKTAVRSASGFSYFGLLAFAFLFGALMTLGEKKFDRYLLPVYLPLDLLAAAGWSAAAAWLGGRVPGRWRASVVVLLLAGVSVIQATYTLTRAPYYLTYYNPLMGGIQRAPEVMSVGWGEGLNEAALYLRDVPGIDKKSIISWYPLAFNYYSASLGYGAEIVEYTPDMTFQDAQAYDIAIVYVNQWQRYTPPQVLDALTLRSPDYTVQIDGVDYVRIYSLQGSSAAP